MMPARDPLRSLVFHAADRAVKDVYVAGRKVVADGKVTTLDHKGAGERLIVAQEKMMKLTPGRDYPEAHGRRDRAVDLAVGGEGACGGSRQGSWCRPVREVVPSMAEVGTVRPAALVEGQLDPDRRAAWREAWRNQPPERGSCLRRSAGSAQLDLEICQSPCAARRARSVSPAGLVCATSRSSLPPTADLPIDIFGRLTPQSRLARHRGLALDADRRWRSSRPQGSRIRPCAT